ncbi:MAG TPA: cytochrome ubiquinol oxidase subunit I [Acidimicrobiales bacterium]|nr:cytochrome ubiquinol oxidase subunit I [Acidimicrobiales bacterium]
MVDFAAAVHQPDLFAARQQMALSLGWHIVIAALGVGFPVIILIAEWRALRTGDATYLALARRWARTLGVLFAVGAVSGTILSFELGILWPGMMGPFGNVIGLPFAIEAIAFFVEAIFLGIYLYGWDRLSPRRHLLVGVPIAVAGAASAWFVVTANAWMNQPRGFRLAGNAVVDVDPWRAMLNPATGPQTTHMIIAAGMLSGFVVASVYARAWLRGRRDRYCRIAFALPFTVAALLAPAQIVVGDWSARFIGEFQPVKLAAAEALTHTQRGAPLRLYAIEIPKGLSLLLHRDANAVVAGLDQVSPRDRPPVGVVHVAFDTMVTIGVGLVGLGGWALVAWARRRELPRSRWFYRAAFVAGPAAVVAVECGWIVTEVGRQPWIVYRILRVADAVSAAPNLRLGYYALLVVYSTLTVGTVVVLRRMARADAA